MRTLLDFDMSPWRVLDAMLGEDQPLGRLPLAFGEGWGRYPRVNAWENDDGLVLEAEVPGVTPDQVEVSVDRNELVLKGRRPVAGSEGETREFERRFELPFDVDAATVQAKYRLGILTLTLPKAPSAQKRRITVEAA